MPAKYTYLLVNILTLIGPIAFLFHPKHNFYKKAYTFLPSILISAFLFLSFDTLYTHLGVWGFNPDYILGVKIWGLPIEEYLFFLTVPYACIFVYQVLCDYIPTDILTSFSKYIMHAATAFSIAVLVMYFPKKYTLFVAIGVPILISLALVFLSSYKRSIFLLSFFISLLPMLAVNGVLTSFPVVWYNDLENSGIRLYSIPVEDFGYNFMMLASNVLLYEYFLSRKKTVS